MYEISILLVLTFFHFFLFTLACYLRKRSLEGGKFFKSSSTPDRDKKPFFFGALRDDH
ncbi:hypothetical protein KAI78_06150 [bacterium]|nr:hypothetical protein [bacterium]